MTDIDTNMGAANSTEAMAQKLLDDRMGSVRELVAAHDNLNRLRGQMAEAEKQVRASYDAAQRKGWTPAELRKLKLDPPRQSVSANGSKRRKSTTS